MGGFSQAIAKAKAPGKTIVLEPWVFADEWEDKPESPVCVGLRLMSEGDKSKARAAAEEAANALHDVRSHRDNWMDAFNDAIMRQVGALGICDPNDVRKPSGILPIAEEQVRFALTSAGARFIFQQIERYEIEASAIEPELQESQVEEFCDELTIKFEQLLPQHKKLLAHVLEAMKG